MQNQWFKMHHIHRHVYDMSSWAYHMPWVYHVPVYNPDDPPIKGVNAQPALGMELIHHVTTQINKSFLFRINNFLPGINITPCHFPYSIPC